MSRPERHNRRRDGSDTQAIKKLKAARAAIQWSKTVKQMGINGRESEVLESRRLHRCTERETKQSSKVKWPT